MVRGNRGRKRDRGKTVLSSEFRVLRELQTGRLVCSCRGRVRAGFLGQGVRDAGGFFFFEIFCIEILGIAGISRGGGGCGPLAAQAVKERFVFRKNGFRFLVSGFRREFRIAGHRRGAGRLNGGRRFALAFAALRVPPYRGIFSGVFFAKVIFLILLIIMFPGSGFWR